MQCFQAEFQFVTHFSTIVLSSAPVKRLFSAAALDLTAKRPKLGDALFKNRSLLKINDKFE